MTNSPRDAETTSDRQLEMAVLFLIAGFAGGWIWDFLLSIQEDYRIITRFTRSPATIVYLLSRIITLVFIVLSVVYYVSSAGLSLSTEVTLLDVTTWFYAFTGPLNCLLFFFRVRAIFRDSPWTIVSFAVLWAFTFAAFLVAPIICVVSGTTCNGINGLNVAPGVFMITIYDTVLYIAVAVRLTKLTSPKGFKAYAKTFFAGHGMGPISQSLFISGQWYYLTVAGINWFSSIVIILLICGVQERDLAIMVVAACSLPNIVLQNALACRVHRHLKLGIMPDQTLPNLGHQQVDTIEGW